MTTNAIDRRSKVVACDSRWSYQVGKALFFVDDSGFDKISDDEFATMIFAGDAVLIAAWKQWFAVADLNLANLPPVEKPGIPGTSVVLSIFLKPNCETFFSVGLYLPLDEFVTFAGSGAAYAKDCYSLNRCAKLAISTAATFDPFTGGETKFVDMESNRHNLSESSASPVHIERQFNERGMVMNLDTKKVVKIQDFNSRGDGGFTPVLGQDLAFSAPMGPTPHVWTDKEREDLKSALQHLSDIRAAAKR